MSSKIRMQDTLFLGLSLGLAIGLCSCAATQPIAPRRGLPNDEKVLGKAIEAFLRWSEPSEAGNTSPTLKWVISSIPNERIGPEISEAQVFEPSPEGIDAWQSHRVLVAECLKALHKRVSPIDVAVNLRLAPSARGRLIVSDADASQICERIGGEPGQGGGCSGDLRFWLPGYCGPHEETSLVLFEASRAVPHTIFRSPFQVGVLLVKKAERWLVKAIWGFGGDHLYAAPEATAPRGTRSRSYDQIGDRLTAAQARFGRLR